MERRAQTSRISSSDMVAAALLERILKGEWRVGDRIPSVDQLEAVFPVSRVTISKGIHKLCRQGYLHSEWRSGTYVRSNELVRRILVHVGGDPDVIRYFPFGMVVTRKLERLLQQSRMQAEIHWEARFPLAGSRLAGDLAEHRFDGVISVQSNLPAQIARHLPALLGHLPIVHVGIHHLTPWVFVDMEAFNRLALAHCRRTGARRILYFTPEPTSLGPFDHATDIELERLVAGDGPWGDMVSEDDAYALFQGAWARLHGQLDAVVVADDVQAKGIVQAVLALGAEVAERLRIVALTNKDSGIFYPLPITAIEVDTDEVVDQAVALLHQQLAHGAAATHAGITVAPQPLAQIREAATA